MFTSTGWKRILSSAITALIPVLLSVPALAPVAAILVWVAGTLGAVGLFHAIQSGTVRCAIRREHEPNVGIPIAPVSSIHLSGFSWTALLSIIVMIVKAVPALQPYQDIVQAIASLFGVTAFTSEVLRK